MAKNRLEDALDQDEETSPEESRPSRRSSKAEDIGDKIAQGITEGLAKMAPQRIKPGSSKFDPKTPFRSKNGPRMNGEFYHNGIWCNPDQMTDDEIKLANQITRSGRYMDRLVEVILKDDAGSRVVMIRHSDRGVDQRMANKDHFRNLYELLANIVKEQNALAA